MKLCRDPGQSGNNEGGNLPRRVTFDSNAWEKVFSTDDEFYAPVRAALADGRIKGFICEAGFRIEAITKQQRPDYFAQPFMDVTAKITPRNGAGRFEVLMSIGPDDRKHPGLHPVQAGKFHAALAVGVQVMRCQAWMGLPRPAELADLSIFVAESEDDARPREGRQIDAAWKIQQRGVGRGAFDDAGGWEARDRTPAEAKLLRKACAEWADGELVAAHIGYQNDILCTDDLGRSAGKSVFDVENRQWLAAEFGVVFAGLDALLRDCAA
jgi:hypothetical protein